jgi:chorismate dehydratase
MNAFNFKLGSVPYLNARPLTDWFSETEEGRGRGASVEYILPSLLAPRLEPGEFAAGLVSSVAWVRRPQLVYAPGVAVACDGPVRSVRLFSQVPLAKIRRVALDTSSLTSVTLTRVLLEERFGLTPEYTPLAPDLETMLQDHDAALLIGDKGYLDYDAGLTVLDLGEAWKEWTNLPFVFALWIGRPDLLTPELQRHLLIAKEWGVTHLDQVAARRAAEHGESLERAQAYFSHAIVYNLGAREEAGLQLFAQKVRAHGLIQPPEPIQSAR